MTIDWITVSAQIVNFLVLVWLLKRFLYRPVISAMDRREQRIADRLQQAEDRERDADRKAQDFQQRREELDSKREELLQQAREDAESEKQDLLDEARADVEDHRRQWQRQVDDEKQDFLDDLERRAAESLRTVASKAVGELAGAALEEQIIATFLERLKKLDSDTRETLADASGPVQIATAFALESSSRGRITRTVHEELTADVEVEYAQSDALLCGIELKRGAHRLGWNLADYLDDIGTRLSDAFQPAAGAES
jgi:F-type H+-transporting ATPase subunit b